MSWLKQMGLNESQREELRQKQDTALREEIKTKRVQAFRWIDGNRVLVGESIFETNVESSYEVRIALNDKVDHINLQVGGELYFEVSDGTRDKGIIEKIIPLGGSSVQITLTCPYKKKNTYG